MPRTAEKLTKKGLDSLRRQAKADPGFATRRADGAQKGLYVRVRDGRVEFWFRVRRPGGKRAMKRIGNFGDLTLQQARETAQEWQGIKSSRRDVVRVLEERDREAVMVSDVVGAYLADFKARAETDAERGRRSSLAEAKRMLRGHVLPKLGRVPVRTLTVDHVRKLHRGMSKTPGAANRVLAALGAAFKFGEREGLVPSGHNPSRHVHRFREPGSRRPLSRDELERLGTALHEAEATGVVLVTMKGQERPRRRAIYPSVVLAVRLIALTGMRRGEVLGEQHAERRGKVDGMLWGDIDLERGLVRLRDSKSGPQVRVLGQAAVDLLREARPKGAGARDCVCPGPGERRKPYRAINAARRLLWRAADLPLERGVDLHSIRHSFASIGAHVHNGRYAGLLSALLGHGYQSKAITERYITADPELLRPAANAIAAEVARLLGLAGAAEVVEIGSRR